MVTPEDVRKIADLARIAIPDDELASHTEKLDRILDYVSQLQELDTGQTEPMMHAAPSDNVFRADEPGACLSTERALANAPEREGPYIHVPRTV